MFIAIPIRFCHGSSVLEATKSDFMWAPCSHGIDLPRPQAPRSSRAALKRSGSLGDEARHGPRKVHQPTERTLEKLGNTEGLPLLSAG